MKKYKINIMKNNLEKYNSTPLFYEKFQILLLMENANTHLVSVFKDYLLYDDTTEFFKEYYKQKEIYPRLKTIYEYYESSSYLFPNYTAINEGKYIYRNIIRKQKLIDYLEDLEDKKKEKEEKKSKKKKKNKNQSQNDQSSSSLIEVFNSKIYENIRKATENDSKINELFCVGNKDNNDCDSFASIIKLTEELKEKYKDIDKEKNIENKNNDNKTNNKKVDKNQINKNNQNNNLYNNKTNNINNYDIKKNKNSNKNINNNSKINKNIIKNTSPNYKNNNHSEGKIYVSRKVSVNQNQNSNIYNKKMINKNIKINNFINNNYFLNGRNNNIHNLTDRTKYRNKLNIDPTKSDDFIKKNKNINSNKNIINNYKKNNIIINIINNNKNNNYHSSNNYFSNYTNTNHNTKESNNNNQNNHNTNNNNVKGENNNTSINTRINTENNNTRSNITIGGIMNSKGTITKNSKSINHNKNYLNKNIHKNKKKYIKSKLLSFRLTDSNFIRNLTERIKKQSHSSSIKKSKIKSKMKSIISPNNKNNMRKRTKTEILGNKTDIFIFRQQNENNSYNKSINRQILKNINLTNNNRQHKEISLVNKKIVNRQFNLNNNKKIKHFSTNSQNSTEIKITSKIGPLPFKEIIKKKEIKVSPDNKTERTSRNHSKDKINNTNIKGNYLDSFSPKTTRELIYNKINKIKNQKNKIYSFLKNMKSNNKIKNLKNKKNFNYTSFNNNTNFQGISSIINKKDLNKNTNIRKNN